MKTELLLRIKAAEDEARKAVQKAEAEAKEILAEARRQAESILSDGREQAEHAYGSKLDSARAQAQKETQKTVAEGQAKADALRAAFDSEVAGATQRVVRLFEERI